MLNLQRLSMRAAITYQLTDDGIMQYSLQKEGKIHRTFSNIVRTNQTSANVYVSWGMTNSTKFLLTSCISNLIPPPAPLPSLLLLAPRVSSFLPFHLFVRQRFYASALPLSPATALPPPVACSLCSFSFLYVHLPSPPRPLCHERQLVKIKNNN